MECEMKQDERCLLSSTGSYLLLFTSQYLQRHPEYFCFRWNGRSMRGKITDLNKDSALLARRHAQRFSRDKEDESGTRRIEGMR
jgi:hypothetical protein